MGYTPNSQARALKTSRTYNLGVVYSDRAGNGLTHNYFNQVLNGFKEYVENLGFDVTFIGSRFGNQRMTILEHAKCRGFDGICIVCVESFEDPMIRELSVSDIPIVTVDYAYPEKPAVLSDNSEGITALVRYAYSMGHRRIAYIYGDKAEVTTVRVGTFLETARKLGIEIPDEYLVEGLYAHTELTEELTDKLLSLADPPTCILMPDDFSAIGGMNAIAKRGLSVPGDVSIMGYDGINLAEVLRPALTTFRQLAERIGTEAAKLLVADIRKEAVKETVMTVNGTLIKGGSVGRIG
jgi:DNA-binding LacI/PurR family transcriptional regulator